MNDWIDLGALWRIVVIGLACGAGLPALFAVGLKVLALGEHDMTPSTAGGATASGGAAGAFAQYKPAALAAAGLCFAVVLAAVGYGIYLIVSAT